MRAEEGTRTPDLPLTRRLLYQLSYFGNARGYPGGSDSSCSRSTSVLPAPRRATHPSTGEYHVAEHHRQLMRARLISRISVGERRNVRVARLSGRLILVLRAIPPETQFDPHGAKRQRARRRILRAGFDVPRGAAAGVRTSAASQTFLQFQRCTHGPQRPKLRQTQSTRNRAPVVRASIRRLGGASRVHCPRCGLGDARHRIGQDAQWLRDQESRKLRQQESRAQEPHACASGLREPVWCKPVRREPLERTSGVRESRRCEPLRPKSSERGTSAARISPARISPARISPARISPADTSRGVS